jgi:pimeloyl-ACP methyl ester carboxylesterase
MGGVTAVFVHGVPETPAVWHGLLAALDRPDAVALSLPGFDSARPAGFGATMDEYAGWPTPLTTAPPSCTAWDSTR